MKRDIIRIFCLAIILVLVSRCNSTDPVIGDPGKQTNGPQLVTFSLSGVNYRFTLPKGFCRTSGKDSEVAANIAAMDPRNMTHFTIIRCEEAGRNADFTRWGMLKTPLGSIGKRVPTRQQWVKNARNSIKTHDFQELFADEYAGYMTGTFSLSISGKNTLLAGAGALTVVRRNVFFYYKYGPYSDLTDLANLLKQVKSEIRVFVTDNPD